MHPLSKWAQGREIGVGAPGEHYQLQFVPSHKSMAQQVFGQ